MSGTFAALLNPLEPAKLAVLLDVARVSKELETPFMLFGAFARDLHFFHAHGIEITRGTADVDVSIQVPDWDSYGRFSEAVQGRGFTPYSAEHPEKLVQKDSRQELDRFPSERLPKGTRSCGPQTTAPGV